MRAIKGVPLPPPQLLAAAAPALGQLAAGSWQRLGARLRARAARKQSASACTLASATGDATTASAIAIDTLGAFTRDASEPTWNASAPARKATATQVLYSILIVCAQSTPTTRQAAIRELMGLSGR